MKEKTPILERKKETGLSCAKKCIQNIVELVNIAWAQKIDPPYSAAASA